MLLGTLGASLFWKMLAGKQVIRAVDCVIKAGNEGIKEGRNL